MKILSRILAVTALVAMAVIGGYVLQNAGPHMVNLTGQPTKAAGITDGPFDGKKLYNEALDAISKHHKDLADPAVRKKFLEDWDASRFDKTGELATEDGTDGAIKEMMQSLGQRFDYFMDKDATQMERDEVSAQLVGIGMTIKLRDQESLLKALPKKPSRSDVEKAMKIGKGHEMIVERTIEGAPSFKFLEKGDEIVKIDGKATDGLTLKEAIALIRGKEGTDVEITVKRTAADGTTSEHTFKITRAVVELKVVTTKDLGNGITYVKLDNFMSKNAVKEFGEALLKASKGKGLVIDLRDNPGGELNAVLTMAAFILPEGTLLETYNRKGDELVKRTVAARREFMLHTQPSAQDPKQTDVSIAKRPPLLIPEDMPIVVLVNEHSASASEILAGLLQHHKRAIVIGKPTVGKGVGQSVIDLSFGRRLHVTSFEFMPAGEPMDWIGIIPNVEIDQAKDEGKTDAQLDAAQKRVKEDIAVVEARAKKAEELSKKNHDEFKKQLESRKKTP